MSSHFTKLIILLLLLQISLDVAAKRTKKQYFNQVELNVEFDITHPILTGNFLADEQKEILILGLNEAELKVASVYSFDISSNSYQMRQQVQLPAMTIAFDIITNHQGIEQLLLMEATELSTLDFSTGIVKPLSTISSIFLNHQPQFIARKKLVGDFNGDKLDDIAISDFSNRTVMLQQADGEFVFNNLPIKANVDMSTDNISFSEPSVFNIDVNFDQRPDVVLIEDSKMVVFEQGENLQFSSIANTISLPAGISAKPWWFMRGADGESVDQSNLEHRMVEVLEDINGDLIVDLMVRQTQSSGVLDRQNTYEIHFGKNVNGVLTFDEKADTTISAEGTLSGLQVIDVNNDGRKEVLVSSFDIGVSQIIGALMSGSIDQDVFLFSLDASDKFNSEPLFSEEVDLNFSLSSGSTGEPVILSADFNGDGFKEIMLSANDERLAIYTGTNDEDMFESRSKRHKLVLPQNGSMLSTSDLNNDNKEEVIVRYGKQDEEELRRKVVILSAKS
ncbi:MAG: VCBS repeat-containing protein [Kangiellaceae bacterium]|nr:VCBS repeat-containing protein [Kangiellaceae bacterium]